MDNFSVFIAESATGILLTPGFERYHGQPVQATHFSSLEEAITYANSVVERAEYECIVKDSNGNLVRYVRNNDPVAMREGENRQRERGAKFVAYKRTESFINLLLFLLCWCGVSIIPVLTFSVAYYAYLVGGLLAIAWFVPSALLVQWIFAPIVGRFVGRAYFGTNYRR